MIWSRYSLVIIPKNFNLLSVNMFVAWTGLYQLFRIYRWDWVGGGRFDWWWSCMLHSLCNSLPSTIFDLVATSCIAVVKGEFLSLLLFISQECVFNPTLNKVDLQTFWRLLLHFLSECMQNHGKLANQYAKNVFTVTVAALMSLCCSAIVEMLAMLSLNIFQGWVEDPCMDAEGNYALGIHPYTQQTKHMKEVCCSYTVRRHWKVLAHVWWWSVWVMWYFEWVIINPPWPH